MHRLFRLHYPEIMGFECVKGKKEKKKEAIEETSKQTDHIGS